MPQISLESLAVLLSTTSTETQQHPASDSAPSKGFGGGGASKSRQRKGDSKPSPALSKADWGPLGKHPDLKAIVALRTTRCSWRTARVICCSAVPSAEGHPKPEALKPVPSPLMQQSPGDFPVTRAYAQSALLTQLITQRPDR